MGVLTLMTGGPTAPFFLGAHSGCKMGLGPSFSLEGLPGLKSVREDVRAFKGLGGQEGLRRQDTFQALHNMIPCDAYCKGTKNFMEAEAEAAMI